MWPTGGVCARRCRRPEYRVTPRIPQKDWGSPRMTTLRKMLGVVRYSEPRFSGEAMGRRNGRRTAGSHRQSAGAAAELVRGAVGGALP
ncbi:hypothetical protein SGPA1_50295 [Streptomyces misionensis JCM 4497]